MSLSLPGEQHGITITYAGAESLIDSTAFGQFLSSFSSHLPLRNLHWKPSSAWSTSPTSILSGGGAGPISPLSPSGSASSSASSSIRTIQTLNTRMEPLADTLMRAKLKPETRHLIQRSLLERPFCHLYFVIGDDSDAYRTHIRNDIRSWLGTIQGTPTLSAATVTARAFQSLDLGNAGGRSSTSTNGASTPRSQTPPAAAIRPGTPTRSSLSDDHAPSNSAAGSSKDKDKDKALPPSPEYLIVVITPPEGSALAPPSSDASTAGRLSPSPSAGSASTPTAEAPRTGLQRFYSSSSSSSTNSTSNKAGGVAEKVKADFNTSRKERVVHLTRLPNLSVSNDPSANSTAAAKRSHADPTIFAELISRIKESVTSTFDAVVGMQEEAVRKELAKRDVPGWNYNKWMASVECLAYTFEQAGLFTDALLLYEEIENVFTQCLTEHKLPYFTHVGGRAEGDDSATLLDINKKDYRDLILRNEISLFDFRIYLFAKRAQLLGKTGRVAQVMSETPNFLSRVATMLQGETLVPHFLESWTFSSAIDVVEQCQAWLIERGDVQAPGMEGEDMSQGAIKRMADRIADSQLSASFHAAKAELLDLARRQLDKIGIDAGHLPNAVPFCLSYSSYKSKPKDRDLPPLPPEASSNSERTKAGGSQKITRRELVEALENREVFDLRYIALSERILAGWISSGRRRNVLRLRCILSSIDFFRGRYTTALSAFASMTEPYAEGQWSKIEAIHIARQLVCRDKLEKPRDRAWVNMLVTFLRTRGSWDICKQASEGDLASEWMDEERLLTALKSDSKRLDEEIAVSRFTPFAVDIHSQTARLNEAEDEDGFMIAVTVTSDLAASVTLDDVRACLTSGENGDVWFTSGRVTLQPGRNQVQLSCTMIILPGQYVVDVSQTRVGKVIFQLVHRQTSATLVSSELNARQASFVTVPEDGDALDATLEWAPHVFLDRSRTGVLTIHTGRNEVERLQVRVNLTSGDKSLRGLAETIFKPASTGTQASSAKMSVHEDRIVLQNLSAQSHYLLLLPFHEVNGIADGVLLVNIELQYERVKDSKVTSTKTFKREVKLPLGLPLGVNVQDFFRHDRLLSKFLISAGAAGPLCLTKVDLWSEDASDESLFTIETPEQEARSIVSLAEPASFVFAVWRNEVQKKKDHSRRPPLCLTLVYRTLHEEANDVLQRSLERISSDNTAVTTGVKRCLRKALFRAALADVDADAYAAQARLRFKPFNRAAWQSQVKQWSGAADTEVRKQLLNLIEQIFIVAEALALQEACASTVQRQQEDVEFDITELQAGRRPWRKLSLPVDIPTMTMVNAVTINVANDGQEVRVGVPVEAVIDIETTYGWNDFENQQQQQDQFLKPKHNANIDDDDDFEDAHSDISDEKSKAKSEDAATPRPDERMFASVDVGCDFVDWLLSGVKRTTITLPKPSKSYNFDEQNKVHKNRLKLLLIPLQSGLLSFPSVSIWPLTEPIATETPLSHAHRRAAANGETPALAVAGVQSANISSDTFVTNEAQRVRVLPRHPIPPRETFWVTSS